MSMTGSQLKALRFRLDLTQAQLAKSVGVAANTVARWERGELPIPAPVEKLLTRLPESTAIGHALAHSPERSLDPHHAAILKALTDQLDPDLFEACAACLIGNEWPGLVPVRGGGDDGFDGAVPDESGVPFPLITTVSRDLKQNLVRNIEQTQRRGWRPKRAIFATSRRITPKMRRTLYSYASDLGVTLAQAYDQDWFAQALYRQSNWCQRLLGVTGRPTALSIYPATSRPLLGDRLFGREQELRWVLDRQGDSLIVGGPGTGQTFLLRALALQGGALFLVDSDRTAIANAVRDLQPTAVIVDDAHIDPNQLAELSQLRAEIGGQFRIIAASWVADANAVAVPLQVPTANTLQLRLVDADTIIEIIKSVGLTGPDELLRAIRVQAEGRPGLAVTLANLCLLGDVEKVASGESLVDQLEPALDRLLDAPSARLLAPFALGGDGGVKPDIVARFLGLSAFELGEKLSRLAAAGLVRESQNGAVSVWPASARWTIVRRVFFGGHTVTGKPIKS